MRLKDFIAKLKKCHRKLVVNELPGRVWGVALKLPSHPDANEHGFVSLCSVPSPSWLTENKIGDIPPETVLNQDGHIVARGWKVVLRILVAQGHLDRGKVNSVFSSHWAEVQRG